jgi:hypothetical protein
MLRRAPVGNRHCRMERLPHVRLFEMEESAATAVDLEAEFTGLSVLNAETGTAIGANLRTQSSALVPVSIPHKQNAAIKRSAHGFDRSGWGMNTAPNHNEPGGERWANPPESGRYFGSYRNRQFYI